MKTYKNCFFYDGYIFFVNIDEECFTSLYEMFPNVGELTSILNTMYGGVDVCY